MTVYVWAFVVALVISFAITPLIKRLAINIGAMDKPDARKVHHGSIPRLGGLAIFIGYIVSVLYTVKDLQAVMGTLIGFRCACGCRYLGRCEANWSKNKINRSNFSGGCSRGLW